MIMTDGWGLQQLSLKQTAIAVWLLLTNLNTGVQILSHFRTSLHFGTTCSNCRLTWQCVHSVWVVLSTLYCWL